MLHQRLRRWPNIDTTLGECVVFVGEALPVNTYVGVRCFELPAVTQQFAFKPKAKLRTFIELYSIIILRDAWFDDCGCGVICRCGIPTGQYCTLGTSCPTYLN